MTTTISLPSQSNFYQWDASNEVGVTSGPLGNATIQTNQYALFMIGANDTLINTSSILQGSYDGGADALGVRGTGDVIINQSNGVIGGVQPGDGGILDDYSNHPLTITNYGFIGGDGTDSGNSGVAIVMDGGGFVSNAATGTLSNSGVYALYTALTVANAGLIRGDAIYGGIDLTAGGLVTNLAGGNISANGAAYGVQIAGAAGTVINAGAINGGSGFAVKLGAGFTNRVVVEQGATFVGTVSGGSTAGGSTLELASVSGTGTLSGFGTQFTNFGALSFDSSASWLVRTNMGGIASAVIDGFVQGDTIDITGFTATSIKTLSSTSVALYNGGTKETLTFGAPITNFEYTTGSFGTDLTTICFCAGTLIDTPDGEVPVQTLKAGNTVLTAHNGPRKVTWVGTGKVLATKGQRGVATPVIVRRGALGDSLPHQDLHVTKAHSLYIDDVLIPVEFLVNHRTILWDDHAQEVEIYHVELESHDVLIANGVPAESYRDDGNRWLFQNANEGWHLPPQEPYAPVLTGGPIVDAVWRRLLDHAGTRDVGPMTDDPDLHLIIDGERVDAQAHTGANHIFRLPARPTSVIVASRAGVPSELGITRDPRALGVALRRVAIRQGAKFMLFDADDGRLTTGFHGYEPADNLRWTNGYAELPIEAFAQFDKGAEVMLHLGGATRYPAPSDDTAQAAA